MSEVSHASESEPLSSDGEPRLPCPRCGSAILVGARKCRSCRRWLDGSPEHRPMPWRFAVLGLVAAALGGFAIARRPTTVGEAPPLTPMTPAGSADATTLGEPAPGALGPAPDPTTADSAAATPVAPEAARGWRTRRIHLDAHPLDAVFSDDGNTLLVSGDDGKIRAYDVVSGRRTQANDSSSCTVATSPSSINAKARTSRSSTFRPGTASRRSSRPAPTRPT